MSTHLPTEPSATPETVQIAIDLSGCETKSDLLARIARAMQFPDWFGHNWDALSDCLTDLTWLPAAGYAIEFSREHDLRRAASEVLDTALEIFDEAAAFWADAGISFQVVHVDDADDPVSATEPPSRR